ncbi:MAG: phosphohistidine phosphatase SixA [Acidobacteria bacterium]|nr:phosphohistidine phosphatase SixA [Acidobacteriota bacterium]
MDKQSSGYLLYILRHGVAVARESPDFPDDDARPLTPKGIKKLQQAVEGLIRTGFEPDWIVTSPLVRAKETAAIVAEALPSKVPMDACDALRPGSSFADLQAFLTDHIDRRCVLLVGHEPDLGRLAARLIGAGPHGNLAFKKGGCCLIQWEQQPFESVGQLVWWLTPRLLRSLAGNR